MERWHRHQTSMQLARVLHTVTASSFHQDFFYPLALHQVPTPDYKLINDQKWKFTRNCNTNDNITLYYIIFVGTPQMCLYKLICIYNIIICFVGLNMV